MDTIALDEVQLKDLCMYWTGSTNLPPRDECLKVRIEQEPMTLPMAETCFRTLIMPVYTTYADFVISMDIVLKHGSKGYSFT